MARSAQGGTVAQWLQEDEVPGFESRVWTFVGGVPASSQKTCKLGELVTLKLPPR